MDKKSTTQPLTPEEIDRLTPEELFTDHTEEAAAQGLNGGWLVNRELHQMPDHVLSPEQRILKQERLKALQEQQAAQPKRQSLLGRIFRKKG